MSSWNQNLFEFNLMNSVGGVERHALSRAANHPSAGGVVVAGSARDLTWLSCPRWKNSTEVLQFQRHSGEEFDGEKIRCRTECSGPAWYGQNPPRSLRPAKPVGEFEV